MLKFFDFFLKLFGVLTPLIEVWVKRKAAQPVVTLQEANDLLKTAQAMPNYTEAEKKARKAAITRALELKSHASGQ